MRHLFLMKIGLTSDFFSFARHFRLKDFNLPRMLAGLKTEIDSDIEVVNAK